MKTLALKIDVNTLRATQAGVPRLVEMLQSRGATATFLFSLGPDRSGRDVLKLLRQWAIRKKTRLFLRDRYGLASLLYGTLLPAPDIGRRCAGIMRATEAAGFEAGIRAWDGRLWVKRIATAQSGWIRSELDCALQRFVELFGHAPSVFGAAGWRTHRIACRQLARAGIAYASDTRGTGPFWPIVEGEPITCLQMPTTLPLLEELVSRDGLSLDMAVQRLLALTDSEPCHGHVYTLQADVEGLAWLPELERLLDGWIAQGYRLVSLGELHGMLDQKALPYHAMDVPGGSADSGVCLQGQPYPA